MFFRILMLSVAGWLVLAVLVLGSVSGVTLLTSDKLASVNAAVAQWVPQR